MRFRSVLLAALALSALAILAPNRGRAADAGEVNLFIWSEYIDPDVIKDFEKQSGLKVQVSLYESNDEMIAKLQHAGGISQYDVVIPSNNVITQMIKLELLQKLDHSKVPNMKNLDPQFTNLPFDPGNAYCAGYLWGTEGLLYRKDKYPNLEQSWSVIFDEKKQAGSFLLIDEARDMMGIALKYNGASTNTKNPDEVKKAGETILAAKKSSKALGFEGGVGAKNKVLSEVADMAIVYNGDAARAMGEDQRVSYMVPKEGSVIWIDNMCIPAKAPNAEGAHKFINFILDADIGARNANFIQYATPNQAALAKVEKKDRDNPAIYPPKEALAKLEYLEDIGDATRLYDEVWTAVKSR